MKAELSQHKLKEQTLACFVFYPLLVPPLSSTFNNLELVRVVELTY